jgi:predicted secreted protein
MPHTVAHVSHRVLVVLPTLAILAMAGRSVGSAQAAESERSNVVQFATVATHELTQDELTITLEAVKEGNQAADVQAELKRVLDVALTEARKHVQADLPQALTVHTGGFNLFPRYNNNGKPNGWQGTALLVLSGNDVTKVSQAAGKLNLLNVVNVSYDLSRAVREQHESQLTSEAIGRFKARAIQMAHDFGMRGYTLGAIAVSSTEPGFNAPHPMLMTMRAKADAVSAETPLPVVPGKGVLSVTVSGEVFLTP